MPPVGYTAELLESAARAAAPAITEAEEAAARLLHDTSLAQTLKGISNLNADISRTLRTIGLDVHPNEFQVNLSHIASTSAYEAADGGYAFDLMPSIRRASSRPYIAQPQFEQFNDMPGIRLKAPIFADLPKNNSVGDFGDTLGIAAKMHLVTDRDGALKSVTLANDGLVFGPFGSASTRIKFAKLADDKIVVASLDRKPDDLQHLMPIGTDLGSPSKIVFEGFRSRLHFGFANPAIEYNAMTGRETILDGSYVQMRQAWRNRVEENGAVRYVRGMAEKPW